MIEASVGSGRGDKSQDYLEDGTNDISVQQVPEPTVHAVVRWRTRLAKPKRVRSILFEESRSFNELERRRRPLAQKSGMSENPVHRRLQARRIGEFRVNLGVPTFVDRTGISSNINTSLCESTFQAIHELLQYRSRSVAVAFAYDKTRGSEGKLLVATIATLLSSPPWPDSRLESFSLCR